MKYMMPIVAIFMVLSFGVLLSGCGDESTESSMSIMGEEMGGNEAAGTEAAGTETAGIEGGG